MQCLFNIKYFLGMTIRLISALMFMCWHTVCRCRYTISMVQSHRATIHTPCSELCGSTLRYFAVSRFPSWNVILNIIFYEYYNSDYLHIQSTISKHIEAAILYRKKYFALRSMELRDSNNGKSSYIMGYLILIIISF